MLQFDWEEIQGSVVRGIFGQYQPAHGSNKASCESVILITPDHAVAIAVNFDSDELSVNLIAPPASLEGWEPITELSDRIGSELGWCWVGRNHMGYLDTFTLAFNGIDPNCMFVGIASTIRIKNLISSSLSQ